MENGTPSYIKSLLMPTGRKPASRKVWSIDLEQVWLPFFTATNVNGDTAIPHDALGCPLRLSYAQDGSVKFSKSGRPIMKVAKEVAESVRLVRENFTASLINYTGEVITEQAEAYQEAVRLAIEAGKPIIAHDRTELEKAVRQSIQATVGEPTPTPEPKPEPEPEAKAKNRKGELVTA